MKKILLLTALSIAVFTGYSQTARVQVIHNCADAAADSVDVYLDGTLLVDNFAFRTATAFIDAPAGTSIKLGVAPKNSTSVADTIYSLTTTLTANNTYILVANGIVSATGYSPAPAFRLSVYGMGRESASMSGNTDVLVMHGSTDAPTVDVRNNADNSVLVDDAMFGDFSASYLELPTNDYVLNLTDMGGMNSVEKYSAPLQTLNLGGQAITVVASGFLTPGSNSNGPAFGLYAATATGGALVQLPTFTSVSELSKNKLDFTIAPNPVSDVLNITMLDNAPGNIAIYDIAGRVVYKEAQTTNKNIDVSSLNSGTYILSVQQEGQSNEQIFIKR